MRFEYQGRAYEGWNDDGVNDVTAGTSGAVNINSVGDVSVFCSRGNPSVGNLNEGTFHDPASGSVRQIDELATDLEQELPGVPLGIALGVWWRHQAGI